MICKCGGILDVVDIEQPPKFLDKTQQLLYKRTCNVQCMECGQIYYGQPYDFGMKNVNLVKGLIKMNKNDQ